MIAAFAAVFLLIGCKGHGSSATIAQSLTNWVWESGSNASNSLGNYASQGTATSTSLPSGRYGAMTWKDGSGQFWVFSGTGGASDMWKFSTGSMQWAWMAGNSVSSPTAGGIYSHVASASNLPGQRNSGSTWIDSSGNLWMFGGYGTDSNGLIGYMNDLWYYSTATNWWTWVGGSSQGGNSAGAPVWGTMGSASAANQPNPRSNAAQWTSPGGMFYMFGGEGYLNNTTGVQNDLWQYNPTSNQWTWLGGSQGLNATGSYGSIGVTSATNQPGARKSATTWVDSSGNFWVFGGTGIDSAGSNGQLNDLWKYNPGNNQWTWVNGSKLINAVGVYGTNDTVAATNLPGARSGATGWIDTSNNLWVFGGYGINSSGSLVILNDLWEYQSATNEWVWLNGSYNGSSPGYYGTLGSQSGSNMPGSRYFASGWTDSAGHFWLFGGSGYDAASANGPLGDVWKFTP